MADIDLGFGIHVSRFSQCFTLLAAAAAPISSKQAVRKLYALVYYAGLLRAISQHLLKNLLDICRTFTCAALYLSSMSGHIYLWTSPYSWTVIVTSAVCCPLASCLSSFHCYKRCMLSARIMSFLLCPRRASYSLGALVFPPCCRPRSLRSMMLASMIPSTPSVLARALTR